MVQKCGCGTHSLEGRRGLVAVLGWYMMGLGPQLGLPLPGLPLVLLSSFRGCCNLEESNGGAGHPPPWGCDLGAGSHGCGPRAMIGFTWCGRSADSGLCTFWVLTAPRSAPSWSHCSHGFRPFPGAHSSPWRIPQSPEHLTHLSESEAHCLSLLPT